MVEGADEGWDVVSLELDGGPVPDTSLEPACCRCEGDCALDDDPAMA